MENLNAEQVKRGLECLNNKIDRDCDTCPIFWKARKSTVTQNCRHIILDAALALINSQEQRIKELTEENAIQVITAIELDKQMQRLTEENAMLLEDNRKTSIQLLEARKNLSLETAYTRKLQAILLEFTETVSKWENKYGYDTSEIPLIPIRNESIKIIKELKADTVNKMYLMIKERCVKGGIYPAFVASTITQVAKELLEGEE